ncbi:MAG: DNA polymerase ligase N-terminal domain-containing protein [Gemmatimonadota bacterium]
MKRDPRAQYKKKRDFHATPEPAGRARKRGRDRFVIQQHDATSMHWDFRLEAGGVLKSWALPKGPSTDPRQKRLAMATEDHPVDYIDFEGVIPEGHYGAGPVIVWDTGSYRNLTQDDDGNDLDLEKALRDGHASVWLEGQKIRGGYALTRIGKGKNERWLLVKKVDEHADARRNLVSTEPESVKTGRTVEEVAEEEGNSE